MKCQFCDGELKIEGTVLILYTEATYQTDEWAHGSLYKCVECSKYHAA